MHHASMIKKKNSVLKILRFLERWLSFEKKVCIDTAEHFLNGIEI